MGPSRSCGRHGRRVLLLSMYCPRRSRPSTVPGPTTGGAGVVLGIHPCYSDTASDGAIAERLVLDGRFEAEGEADQLAAGERASEPRWNRSRGARDLCWSAKWP